MAGERDPTVFQPWYPNRTVPQRCQQDSSAVTGQEVLVELSDLCRVLWLCGVTSCNGVPGGSWAASEFPVGAALP